ncbi:MAG: hypothetical protein E7331_10420 [Clostridiales bacterium]|nr:hypothetical protein [Clostridiales bacterium]
MAYYCGECAVWLGSSDTNNYGERWCAYSRKYEKSDQQTYGCRGFVYVGRSIITKVCEMLKVDSEKYFTSFDEAKNNYVVAHQMPALMAYCQCGPQIATSLSAAADRQSLARQLMQDFIMPAHEYCVCQDYQSAFLHYQAMVHKLVKHFSIDTVR